MGIDDLRPRSRVLGEAWDKAKGEKGAEGQAKEEKLDERLLVSVAEACKRLDVSKTFLYDLMNAGSLSYVKLGSRRKIPVKELEKFVDEELKREREGRNYGG